MLQIEIKTGNEYRRKYKEIMEKKNIKLNCNPIIV